MDDNTTTPEETAHWGYGHDVGVERECADGFKLTGPVVWMCNDGDPYYEQFFESREKVEEFIKKLRAAADEAWPA